MDTIKTYLENMFAGLPGTPDVMKAKNELFQMMEDKYNELIEEGISDNEAVGRVISEFGNLEEISEELGINNILTESIEVERKVISEDEARSYMSSRRTKAILMALGIAFCIMSVIPPIIIDALDADINDSVGAAGFFAMVAIGVVLIVASNIMNSKWDYLNKELCMLDYSAKEYVKEKSDRHRVVHAISVSVGVALFILSVVPAAILSEIEIDGLAVSLDNLGGAALFVFVAIGVFLIVRSSTVKSGYEKLIGLEDRTSVRGKITKTASSKEVQYISESAEIVMSVYWTTVTCIYLSWSFLTFNWGFTWIIWPIAAIIHTVLENALKK